MGNNVFQSPFNITSAAINAALAGSGLSLPAGAVGAPSLNFGNPLYGFYASSSGRIDVAINGQNRMRFTSDLALGSAGAVTWSNGTSIGTADVSLSRDAAGVLALNGGVSPQAFRICNTYTDASNYERLSIDWSGNVARIIQQAAGTGSVRNLVMGAGTTLTLDEASGAATISRGSTSSNTIFQTTTSGGMTGTVINFARFTPTINQASGSYNVLDLNPTEVSVGAGPHYLIRGRIAAGSNLFEVSNGGGVYGAAYLQTGGTAYVAWGGNNVLRSRSSGVLTLGNFAETDFGRLQFGGITASFPSLKRLAATLQARLADDSGYADFSASSLITNSSTVFFGSNGTLAATADGSYKFANNAGTDFGRLQFGGTTSSFPAISRTGARIQFRLADDSDYAIPEARYFRPLQTTFSGLVAAGTAGAGAVASISDATATTPRSIAAGGGANKVMVWSDGTNWLIF